MKKKKLVFYCRTKDEGSVVTSEKLTAVKNQLNDNNISFGGAGYLFDNVSYDQQKTYSLVFYSPLYQSV